MENDEFGAVYRKNAEQNHLLEFFTPTAQTSVLEIGSGGGRWGFFFADKVSYYQGLDLSAEMVALAEKERLRRGLENVHFAAQDLLSWESSRKFDLIYFSGVLQYMNDDVVADTLGRAGELLAEGGVIVSRDSIQTQERVEREGEYPVVYRCVSEYADLFARAGYRMVYSARSYPGRRFTRVVSRLYRLPFVSYAVANAFCETLEWIDRLLGGPAILKSSAHRRMLAEANRREHLFFKYLKAS